MPIVASMAAIVPAIGGVVRGERPESLAWVGICVILIAVILLAQSPREQLPARHSAAAPLFALVSGISFGSTSILIEEGGDEAGLWPLLFIRVVMAVVLLVPALKYARSITFDRPMVMMMFAVSAFIVAGDTLFVLALQRGLLSLVAVVAGLHPAATIAGAHLWLHEKLSPLQWLAASAALVGVSLVGAA